MDLIPATFIDRVLAVLPAELHEPARQGFAQLQIPAMEVALAATRAEQETIPFREAVRDETRFGPLSRFHYGWIDLLQFELPPALAETVRAGLRQADGLNLDHVRKEMFTLAAHTTGATGSLLRFLLSEILYANVLLAVRGDDGTLEASGCLSLIEAEAQRVVEHALADSAMQEPGVRPLETMFAGLFVRLERTWAALAPTIAKATTEFHERFAMLIEASHRAKLAAAADAAIIRGALEREFDGESVGSQRTADRHPLVFASAEAVDQRRSRLRRRWIAGEAPRAAGIRLVDILFEDLSKEA